MKIFEPFTLKHVALKNRIVRSATYEKRADTDGFVTPSLISLYEELAAGGSGIIITGCALVHITGRMAPRMICLHNDNYVEKLTVLNDTIRRYGALSVIQLIHGGRQSHPSLLGGHEPAAPSAVYDPSTRIMPRPMSGSEIWEAAEAFGAAARRAMQAGFDGVQIQAAHGYLLSQFLSPHTNRRDDYWGGDEARRFHFIEEVCTMVRDEIGYQGLLLVKMNGEDGIEGGLSTDECTRIACRLESLGVDAIEISGGMFESRGFTIRRNFRSTNREAYFRDACRRIKQAVRIPVMTVGGIRSKSAAEDIIVSGDADLVSFSRPLIREPDLPAKFREGKEMADCISCNGCLHFNKADSVRCVQLPHS